MQETSLQAYEEIEPKIGERQKEVLNALEHFKKLGEDATDQEITIYLGKSDPNYVRPRRHELVNKYKVVGFSDRRICKITGKMALAWKLLLQAHNLRRE